MEISDDLNRYNTDNLADNLALFEEG